MELMSLVPHERSWTENYLSDPRIVHICETPKEPDEVDSLVTGSGFIDHIRRWIVRKSILSRNHPITRTCVKSSAAINYEISRHIRSYRYTIYPFSQIRSFWETSMIIVTVITLIIVPVDLAFDFDTTENTFYMNLIINIVFILDIVMTLLTGHYDHKTRIIILERKIVAGKYLKGFFILDLLSSVPTQVFHVIFTGSKRMNWYWAALDLTKIFRLRTVVLYSRKLRHLYGISFHKYKIFEMTIIIIICIHWATCLELYVGLAAREIDWKNRNRGSWLMSEIMKDKNTKLKIYFACANRAIISLVSSSHYLDVKTTEDILLNLVLTIAGRIGVIYIIAQFFQLLTTFHSTIKRRDKFLQQLQEFMQYKELPYIIQRRLRVYYNYYNKKGFERFKCIISNVSPRLREELLLHNYSRLVDSVDFFRYLPQSVVVQIVGFLRTEIYLTNDTIVKAGTIGDALFFIASGTVAVFTNNKKEICHLEDGSYFGEVSLVMANEERMINVSAIETCEIWTLRRADFLHCLNPHPNLLNRLQKIAVERLEKNLFSDRAHRLARRDMTSVDKFGDEGQVNNGAATH